MSFASALNAQRFLVVAGLLTTSWILFFFRPLHLHSTENSPGALNHTLSSLRPTVAKVTMQYGSRNDLYLRALATHERHAQRHGYPVYTLRSEITDGIWNKLTYILSIMIDELQKRPEERVEWWVDADSLVVNPALPVDIFFPPYDFPDYHILASRDASGFNAGVFFIRVHRWSVRFISKAMAFPQYRPEVDLQFLEQSAMAILFEENDFAKHVLWQPRIWWNTYEFTHAYEGEKGDLMVHFPGLNENRWPRMTEWLAIVEGPQQQEWELPLEKTRYPHEINRYWNLLRDARDELQRAKELVVNNAKAPVTAVHATERLEKALIINTDEIDKIANAVDDVQREITLWSADSTSAESTSAEQTSTETVAAEEPTPTS